MKMLDCLPKAVSRSIERLRDVREIRIRNNRPVKVNVGGKWYYINACKPALQLKAADAFVAGGSACDDIITVACNKSVYAHEKSLSNGFFTLDDGVRVGVCGVVQGDEKTVFQKYTSLCFRVPHSVNCVDDDLLSTIEGGNVIIIGVPSSGKTTLLRDCAVKLSQRNNVLVVDERGELYYSNEIGCLSDADVLKWTSKDYAFNIGVRSLAPEYIVFDEIAASDGQYVKTCIDCGVKVLCTAHGSSYKDFAKRFESLQDCFDYAVVLGENFSRSVIDCKSSRL